MGNIVYFYCEGAANPRTREPAGETASVYKNHGNAEKNLPFAFTVLAVAQTVGQVGVNENLRLQRVSAFDTGSAVKTGHRSAMTFRDMTILFI